jgi:hypothetical protein
VLIFDNRHTQKENFRAHHPQFGGGVFDSRKILLSFIHHVIIIKSLSERKLR